MTKSKLQITNYGLLLFVLLGLVLPLPAQQAFVPCEGLSCTLSDLLEVPVNIFNFLLGMAAVVLLAVIIWAGMRMILYHVSEMPEQELVSAKMTLQRGITGFLIIAFSYVLVNLLIYSLLGLDTGSGVAKLLENFGL